jgi:uncharacterized protein YigE (DUF2233 family)
MKLTRPLLIAIACFAGIAAAAALFVAPRARDAAGRCITRDFETSRFVVCTLDARQDELRITSRDPRGGYIRSFEALAASLGGDARRVRFAMNAGMYNDRGAPIGLYVAEGEQQQSLSLTDGPGNFHMKPNGVFWQDPNSALHIATSDTYAAAEHSPIWATQSGPMLVVDGALHSRFAEDGASRYIRNGVGLRDNHTAYFVISSGFVSFGRFARFFRDELGCENALFFDGTVSSLWAPSLRRSDDDHALGPMIVVLDRR